MKIPVFAIALTCVQCSGGEAAADEVVDEPVTNEVAETEEAELTWEDPLIEEVTFPSRDGLTISGTTYQMSETNNWILLCHQARWSQGEYKETATEFLNLGYNAMTIDQRSGGEVNGIVNQTFTRAEEQGLPTDYLDAEQDIEAAIDYLYGISGQPVVLVGSSYSSTLACYELVENDKVRAIVSFSPGNYFMDVKGDLTELMAGTDKPFWVTSSKSEAPDLTAMLEGISLDDMHVQFVPEGEGEHGSRALWSEKPDHEEYWNSLIPFLTGLNNE